MKRSAKIVFGGMCAALITVLMMAAYFPYLTFAVPAVASIIIMVCLIEFDEKWALLCYLASLLPVILLAENESKILYIAFFGYYPVLKALCERINLAAVRWAVKLVVFNAVVVLTYFILSLVTNITIDYIGDFGRWTILVLLLAGNVVFVIYDFTLSALSVTYMNRLHNVVQKMMNRYTKK